MNEILQLHIIEFMFGYALAKNLLYMYETCLNMNTILSLIGIPMLKTTTERPYCLCKGNSYAEKTASLHQNASSTDIIR